MKTKEYLRDLRAEGWSVLNWILNVRCEDVGRYAIMW